MLRGSAIERRFLPVLIVGLCALSYPLSWLPKSWAHFRFSLTVPWPEMVLTVALFALAGWFLRERDGETRAGVFLPLVAILFSAILSTRFSDHPHLGLAFLPRLAGNMAIFLLAAHAPKDRVSALGRWWMIVAVLVAGNGLLRLGSETVFTSTFGNWNFLGAYLAASLVIGVSIRKRWSLAGSAILLATLVVCRSRGAWLALAVVAMLGVFCAGKQAWKAGVVLLAIVTGFLAFPYAQRQWETDVRPIIWKSTLRMMAQRPVLGHGPGAFAVAYPKYRLPEYFLRPKATNVTDHAHNELLEVVAEQGILGVAGTLWLWMAALGSGRRAYRQAGESERWFLRGLFGATLVFLLHGMVDVDLRHLPNQSLLWLLMGLLVGAGAAPATWPRVSIRSKFARVSLAAACLVFGMWVLVRSVIFPVVADLRDRQARLAEERGDLEIAAQRAWQALEAEPFRLSTRYLLAGVLTRTGSLDAIEQCLRLEELAPDYADVTFNLGQLYLAANRPADAVPYLRRAVEINPYDANRRAALEMALQLF